MNFKSIIRNKINMNKQENNNIFLSPTKGKLSFNEMVDEIFLFLNQYREGKFEIIIGTDSQKYKGGCDFATVIIVHWVGHFARYFWTKNYYLKIQSLRDRIYREASLSLELSQKLLDILKNKLSKNNLEFLKCELEIHVDIGQKGATRAMIKEIIAMIEASGFKVKIKPEAFGASTVADRHT